VLSFRPYEIIALATCKGIAVLHVGFNPESDGRLSTEIVAVLPGHNGEVCMLTWYCCVLYGELGIYNP
jgi:nucleoporin SEH1